MLTRDMVEDETGEENDEEQVGPPHEPCQVYREWPHAAILMRELNADGFFVLQTDEFFHRMGRKYDIFFWAKGAEKRLVAIRTGARKCNAQHGLYFVSDRTPKPVLCPGCHTKLHCARCDEKSG